MNIIGLDLSLSSTGIATHEETHLIITNGYTKKTTLKSDPVEEERKRLHHHHQRIKTICQKISDLSRGCDLVVMEGLAFSAHDYDRQNAGLAWIVRHRLYANGIPYALVPPLNLKKYVTGTGKSRKEEVIAAVQRWRPRIGNAHDEGLSDICDAYVLMSMGRWYCGFKAHTMPPLEKDSLAGCTWPAMGLDENVIAEVLNNP